MNTQNKIDNWVTAGLFVLALVLVFNGVTCQIHVHTDSKECDK